MSTESSQANRDSCPWCGSSITDRDETVAVRTERRQVPDQVLHDGCATEWERFIRRARRIATSGARQPLLDAALERGFAIDDGE